MRVWVDQGKCTGDGLCAQYAPEVFEFDIDGLAYVKDPDGNLLTDPGARTDVPEHLRLEVVAATDECPGECIHLDRASAGGAVPAATEPGGTEPGGTEPGGTEPGGTEPVADQAGGR